MLKTLNITHLATIESLHLDFTSGLTVISGESGAGKSLILDALGLVLGRKADAGLVRFGATVTKIEALFDTGYGDNLLLSREITVSGKSKCKINNKQESLQSLNLAGKKLASVQGQAEHHSIFAANQHAYLIDEYGGLEEERKSFEESLKTLKDIRNELRILQSTVNSSNEHRNLLEFQINEIEAANIIDNEDIELEREHLVLANARHLIEAANNAYNKIYGETDFGNSSTDLIQAALNDLRKIADTDSAGEKLYTEIEMLADQLYSLTTNIRNYRDSLFHDPQRLEEVESRIGLLSDLKRKYGGSLEAVFQYYKSSSEELNEYSSSSLQLPELKDQEKEISALLFQKGSNLSAKRRAIANKLCNDLQTHLDDLGMGFAKIDVSFSLEESADAESLSGNKANMHTGLLDAEFVISTNPGEPMQPLGKIASGGEAARVMIALKAVLTEQEQCPTLLFDEIDEAIGGEIAFEVGKKLCLLSEKQQIICITHLPQIACFADNQIGVSKNIFSERMVTSALKVESLSRITEIDRMLGGLGGASEKTAKQMIEFATRTKNNTMLSKK